MIPSPCISSSSLHLIDFVYFFIYVFIYWGVFSRCMSHFMHCFAECAFVSIVDETIRFCFCGNAFLFQIGMPTVFEIVQWRSIDGSTICIGQSLRDWGRSMCTKIPIAISMCINLSWDAALPRSVSWYGAKANGLARSVVRSLVGVS